ncbi:BQ5605_C015g07748 [Microbotryum silenes-dioicae]|uniref:BQ5605_C015g07748 protein n=1 Tax=Microbotryum silenes-dioicae TaxID=796604 RepID=A0A2X0LWH6_9BASI|nr:BQ5605_C015g07748 [Microbotryum silenes-dioicae]
MPVRFCTLFVSLERQCLLPLHSRNFSTLLLPAMTTASSSTNDHAALSSTESPAATIGGAAGVHVALLLPPMQLSGALDTTAGTTYDGALFDISAETIKWAKDRKDPPMSCLSQHPQVKIRQDARYSYVLLIKEAVDPMTASIIVGGAQSPSEMFDRHFESVAMRTCDSNWFIMRKYDSTVRSLWWSGFKVSKIKVFGPFDQSIMAQVSAALNVAMKWAELAAEHQSSCARVMERPVDDLIEARGRIQAMEEATLGGEDWKPILPLLKPVVVAPAVVVVTSVVPLSAVPRAAACTNYNSRRVCITNLSPLSCRAATSASRPRRYLSGIASSASVLWFRGCYLSGIASRASVFWFRGRIPHRSRFVTSAYPRADVLDSNLRFSLPGRIPTVRASSRPCTCRCLVPTGSVVLSKVVTFQASRRVPPFSNLGVKSPTARAFSRPRTCRCPVPTDRLGASRRVPSFSGSGVESPTVRASLRPHPLSAAPADPPSITELPIHGVGRAPLEPVAAGSKGDVLFVSSMPALGSSPAPKTSARMRIMAREVDLFRDARYKIVTPLDAEGFDFGIKDPPSERHIAKNAPLTKKQQLVMDGEMERLLDLGYIAGPYDKDELQAAVGPFCTNPISYVPKSVAPGMPPKWKQIENLSYPTAKLIDRTTDPDKANHPSQRSGSSSRLKLVSINDDLKSADSPCRWTTLPMLYRKFRKLPSTAEVCGWV